MQTQVQKNLLERLIESNIKTQESVAEIVKAIKELTAALRAAAELPEDKEKVEEVKEAQNLKEPEDITKQLSAKLDKMLEQNALLLKALNELATSLKIRRL